MMGLIPGKAAHSCHTEAKALCVLQTEALPQLIRTLNKKSVQAEARISTGTGWNIKD